MIQPQSCLINVGLLMDAVCAAGGLSKFAKKSGVAVGKVNMLLQGRIPNPGPLSRICQGAGIKPSELIVNAGTFNKAHRQKNSVVLGRWPLPKITQDAG